MSKMEFSAGRYSAPLRITLCGGGTDIPGYCEKYGSAIVGASIKKFVYAYVNSRFHPDNAVYVDGNDIRILISKIERLLGKEQVREIGDVFVESEVPVGSGLGASSAMWVAVIRGILGIGFGTSVSEFELGQLAFEFERKDLKQNGGFQDHFFSAMPGIGGLVYNRHYGLTHIRITNKIFKEMIESSCCLVYCGDKPSTPIIPDLVSSEMDIETKRTLDEMQDWSSKMLCRYTKSGALGREVHVFLNDMEVSSTFKHTAFPSALTDNVSKTISQVKEITPGVSCKIQGSGGGGYLLVSGYSKDISFLKEHLGDMVVGVGIVQD